jgi:aminomethyltransferase
LPEVVQLQEFHEKNGHLAEFSGFNLPLWFKGIIPESLAVRNTAGIFDVSHMGRTIIRGKDSQRLLDSVTTNDVASLKVGQAQYSLICNPEGGIKDDVMVYRLANQEFLIVYNAGNRAKDYDWILTNSRELDVSVEDVSDNVAMFAVQGPKARQLTQQLSKESIMAIPRFACSWTELVGNRTLISRTGYTGEDGFEVFVWDSTVNDPRNARAVWDRLLEVGKSYGLEPCGLGARDLLRLEAGLCLYGTDMDENTNPYEAKLNFVVKLQKGDFVGKRKLQEIKDMGTTKVRVGLVTTRRVIPRHGFEITSQRKIVGKVTSGTLSPLLNTGIAMGYVEKDSSREGNDLEIQVRDRHENAKVVKPPFYDTAQYGYSRKL